MTLHIVNHAPPQSDALMRCLRLAAPGDSLILIEDAVLAATGEESWLAQARDRGVLLYALRADLEARGVDQLATPAVIPVDDANFVQLCCDHARSLNWY